jgi:adenylate cyclase
MVGNSGSDSATRSRDRRKLIAVLYADMVGYTRLIGLDDTGTLERLRRLRKEVIDPAIEEHGGHVVQTGGDSLLIVFDSVDGAVQCAIHVQRQVLDLDNEPSPDRAMRFRIGINIGDAIADGTDLHGDAVNVAVRLQAECPPGGICVTRAVRDHVRHRFDLAFEELGALRLKNIDRPVEAFALKPAKAAMATAGAVAPVGGEPLPLPDVPSIVVLPFQNISSDPEQDYLADGMVEDITTALSRFRSLFVIARNSAFTYKGRSVDIREIGRQLGVRYVVEGSVRKAQTRVRITCQLIQAENGAHLWGEQYDRDFSDIFALQDEITTNIVSTLAPTVLRVEIERARRRPAESLDAYDLYLRALAAHHSHTREGNEEARRLLDRTLVLDPHFVPALVLADSCWLRGMSNSWVPRAEALERCSRYARLAVHLAPDDADALSTLAERTAAISGDHEDAVVLANRAVAANPNSSAVLNKCGHAFSYAGRLNESLALYERALRLSPRDPAAFGVLTGMGWSLIQLGRDAEAIEVGKRAAQLNPVSPDAFRVQASALALLGRLDEAKAALQRVLELDPGCTVSGIRMRYGTPEGRRASEGFRKAGMPE